jgi:hypothetical protein
MQDCRNTSIKTQEDCRLLFSNYICCGMYATERLTEFTEKALPIKEAPT